MTLKTRQFCCNRRGNTWDGFSLSVAEHGKKVLQGSASVDFRATALTGASAMRQMNMKKLVDLRLAEIAKSNIPL
nr:hypothetical protein [Caballeronia catudaia]